ncbi:UDP-N-acetylglucosamine 2-epimerase [Thalassospira povalilytica]|uniref:UDP-N-acetylglucosamine 2-epimerase n=1 Tax=Thalassospira povalilytica TaxID=732237 RepID=UPI003AA8A658
MNRTKVCVVTGTRAEYGLLYWLMREIRNSDEFELQVLVTGTHLSPAHGNTWREIEKDGFEISKRIEMLVSGESPSSIVKSMGLALVGIADALAELQPDLIVVLGDRYETLCAAQAAMIFRVPIAHLHGGEATEGLIDEAIRHSLTKMSHLHFVSAEDYRRRVIQLGEQPENVFNVGSFGLDHLPSLDIPDRKELEEDIGVSLSGEVFLITFHPVTLLKNSYEQVDQFCRALEYFPEATMVITGTNADTDGFQVREKLQEFAASRNGQTLLVESLGQRRYLGLMHHASAVIGNSSSGLLEAPAVGVPTVNVGNRQKGRLTAPSVISCGETTEEIVEAITRAISSAHRELSAMKSTPYGKPGAARRTVEILRQADLSGLVAKRFYDIEIEHNKVGQL